MLSIKVEFLGGTLRTGSADDLALTGDDPGEWPPSPARLFSSLVAADGTGSRCRVTTGAELTLLEQAPPPLIQADARTLVRGSPLAHRFVVIDKRSTGSVQEYPGRGAAQVRPGSRLSPFTPNVVYHWPGMTLDANALYALSLRAARVGYLGCSDSAVRVRVSDQPDMIHASSLTTWEPTDDFTNADVALPVTFSGLLEVLDESYQRFTLGEPVRRAWFLTQRQGYRVRREAESNLAAKPFIAWMRFEQSVPGRMALSVAETLRRSTLELFDRWVTHDTGEVPQVLTGHGFTGQGYQHAHWLVLPEVGNSYSKGRLHGAAVWLPPQTAGAVVAGVNSALVHLSELCLPGGRRIALQRNDETFRTGTGKAKKRSAWAASPERWKGPARRWESVLPVVHERWGPVTLAEVAGWCAHAGLPYPVAYQCSRLPFIEGALSLTAAEVFRDGRERRPFSHLRVEFAAPVDGPVMLGRGRQFGMGLLCPTDRDCRSLDGEAGDE